MTGSLNHTPPKWKSEELYGFLSDIFPDHRTPFKRLDVDRLAGDIGKSYEALYQKLRKGRLNVEWAKLLCEFARDDARLIESNVAAARAIFEREFPTREFDATATEAAEAALLQKARKSGRKPPSIEQDFMRFFI